jgi:hypothetical protein
MVLHKLLTGLCILLATASFGWAVQSNTSQPLVISSLLEVGYYVQIVKADPIKIKPDSTSIDPYHTYTGCGPVTLIAGFPCQLSTRAVGTTSAGGKWETTVRPSAVARGTTQVRVCVTGKGLSLESLTAGSTLKVAEVIVTIIPR